MPPSLIVREHSFLTGFTGGIYLDFDFPTKDMIENGRNFYEARGKRYIVIFL